MAGQRGGGSSGGDLSDFQNRPEGEGDGHISATVPHGRRLKSGKLLGELEVRLLKLLEAHPPGPMSAPLTIKVEKGDLTRLKLYGLCQSGRREWGF